MVIAIAWACLIPVRALAQCPKRVVVYLDGSNSMKAVYGEALKAIGDLRGTVISDSDSITVYRFDRALTPLYEGRASEYDTSAALAVVTQPDDSKKTDFGTVFESLEGAIKASADAPGATNLVVIIASDFLHDPGDSNQPETMSTAWRALWNDSRKEAVRRLLRPPVAQGAGAGPVGVTTRLFLLRMPVTGNNKTPAREFEKVAAQVVTDIRGADQERVFERQLRDDVKTVAEAIRVSLACPFRFELFVDNKDTGAYEVRFDNQNQALLRAEGLLFECRKDNALVGTAPPVEASSQRPVTILDFSPGINEPKLQAPTGFCKDGDAYIRMKVNGREYTQKAQAFWVSIEDIDVDVYKRPPLEQVLTGKPSATIGRLSIKGTLNNPAAYDFTLVKDRSRPQDGVALNVQGTDAVTTRHTVDMSWNQGLTRKQLDSISGDPVSVLVRPKRAGQAELVGRSVSTTAQRASQFESFVWYLSVCGILLSLATGYYAWKIVPTALHVEPSRDGYFGLAILLATIGASLSAGFIGSIHTLLMNGWSLEPAHAKQVFGGVWLVLGSLLYAEVRLAHKALYELSDPDRILTLAARGRRLIVLFVGLTFVLFAVLPYGRPLDRSAGQSASTGDVAATDR